MMRISRRMNFACSQVFLNPFEVMSVRLEPFLSSIRNAKATDQTANEMANEATNETANGATDGLTAAELFQERQ